MKWTITGQDVASFLQIQTEQYMESPTFYFDEIEWVLIAYPRGWNSNHKSMKIFLTSKGELHPKCPDKIPIIIKLTSNLNNNTEWNERVILHRDNKNNKGFQYKLTDKIPISHINTITPIKYQPHSIIFNVELFDQKNNINIIHNEEQKNPEKSDESNPTKNDLNPNDEHKKHNNIDNKEADNNNNNDNNNDMISHQILRTYPHSTKSEIYRSNMISSTNIWRITGSEMHRFLNAKCGEMLESAVFEHTDCSEWKLIVYPNGTDPDKEGSVAVFLECSKFPNKIETFSVLYDVYCCETDTYSSNTFTLGVEMDNNYRRNSMSIWHPYTVELSALKYETQIILETTLTVLRTQYTQYHSNKGLGFITKIIPFKPIGPKLKMEWTLPCNPTVYNARNDKKFASKRCDIWCLRCTPNHYNYVSLELYLVCSPHNVNDIEVDIVLKCSQFNIESKERTTFKKEHEKYREWKNINLPTKKLENIKYIKFECEIEILHQYGRRGKEIMDLNESYHSNYQQQQQQQQQQEKQEEKQEKPPSNKENEKKEQEIDIISEKENTMKRISDFTNKILEVEKKITLIQAKQTENEEKKEKKEKKENEEKKENKNEINYNDGFNDYGDDDMTQRLQIWFNKQLRLPQYLEVFVNDGWDDLETIKQGLKEKHLNGLIEKQGHRVKILQHINILRQQTNQ